MLYVCNSWALTKRLEKKLDGNYTRMLRAILNKSWQQHPTKHQLYSHLPPITKTIQIKRTRHAGHSWRSREELMSYVLLWTPAYGRARVGRLLEHTYSSYMRIRDLALRTCQRRWTIGRSGERRSRICVLAERHDDDDVVLSNFNKYNVLLNTNNYTVLSYTNNYIVLSNINNYILLSNTNNHIVLIRIIIQL